MDGLLGTIEETWFTLMGDGAGEGAAGAPGPEPPAPPAAPPAGSAGASKGAGARAVAHGPGRSPKKFEKNDKDDTIIHYRGTTPQQQRGRGGKGDTGDPTWLLGINVLVVDGLVSVKSFVPNSICEDQLAPGDVIHSIDGKACTSVESLRSACPGTAGSLLRVCYSRPPGAQPLELVLERAVLPCGTGYFRKISNQLSPAPDTAAPVDLELKSRADAAREIASAAASSSVEATLASLDKSTRTSPPPPSRAGAPPRTPPQPPSSSKAVRQSKDGRDLRDLRDLRDFRDATPAPERSMTVLEAMTREREKMVEERIEVLIALTESTHASWQHALVRVQGLRDQTSMLLQENTSLRYRLQVQAHAASARSAGGNSYEALARRNRALENEVRALTEDLDDHYVPVTVLDAVIRERDAAHRDLEWMRRISSRTASRSSSPRLPAQDGGEPKDLSTERRGAQQGVSTEASQESTVHGSETTQASSKHNEVTRGSERGKVGDEFPSDERQRLQRERDELQKERDKLRQDLEKLQQREIRRQMRPKDSPEKSDADREDGPGDRGKEAICAFRSGPVANDTVSPKKKEAEGVQEEGESAKSAGIHLSPSPSETQTILNQSSIAASGSSPWLPSPDAHAETRRSVLEKKEEVRAKLQRLEEATAAERNRQENDRHAGSPAAAPDALRSQTEPSFGVQKADEDAGKPASTRHFETPQRLSVPLCTRSPTTQFSRRSLKGAPAETRRLRDANTDATSASDDDEAQSPPPTRTPLFDDAMLSRGARGVSVGGSGGGLSRLSANLSHLAASPTWRDMEGRDVAIAKGQDTAVGKGADGDVDGGRDSEQFPDDAVGERRASKSRSWFENVFDSKTPGRHHLFEDDCLVYAGGGRAAEDGWCQDYNGGNAEKIRTRVPWATAEKSDGNGDEHDCPDRNKDPARPSIQISGKPETPRLGAGRMGKIFSTTFSAPDPVQRGETAGMSPAAGKIKCCGGLRVMSEPPYRVLSAAGLLDANGRPESDTRYSNPRVELGDRLVSVNGEEVEGLEWPLVSKMLELTEDDGVANLGFFRDQGKKHYSVKARLAPKETWQRRGGEGAP